MTHSPAFTEQYLQLKRALFDKYYSFLNDMQRQAVYTVNGPLLILAGAGSGKTTVLVNRIVHIIRYGDAYATSVVPADADERTLAEMQDAMHLNGEDLAGFLMRFRVMPPPAWAMLAITFTNKAAGEIKSRLAASFGEGSTEASEIWAGTFHSICMRILRRWCTEIGYQPGFGVCDADDAKKLVSDCMKQLNIDDRQLPAKSVLNMISRAKDRLMTPEEFTEKAVSDFKLKQISRIYTVYQSRLYAANLLDFDDIIMQTVRLLRECEAARDQVQRKFRYVCVDEYQDTNKAQLELTLLLSGGYNNIMVVGDDDQSIYRFRGATIENILNFEETCKGAQVIKLEQNYRSTKRILDAANSVISKNTSRHDKTLWTSGEEGDKIVLRKLGNQNDEARFICDEILSGLRSKTMSYRDYAVLYRTNAQSRSLEQVFAKSGIPYRMLGGQRFYDRMEIRDILAYLCVINNPRDDLRLKRILNVPKRGIGAKSAATAEAMAVASGIPMLEFMENAQSYRAIPPAAAKSMEELAKLIRSLRTISSEKSIADLIRAVVDVTGYGQMLTNAGEGEAERLDNIGELISSAAQYDETTEEPSLAGFLEDVALVSDVDKYDDTADAVVLMTIHSAKGLEFPVVFLPGMEEGIFPGHHSIFDPSEIEEERRLAYVAITRAKKKVYILHVHDRMLNGSTQYNQLSRFVDEIPDELIDSDLSMGTSALESVALNTSYTSAYPRSAPSGISQTVSPSRRTQPITKSTMPSMEKFEEGDRIRHSTFGAGVILSVRPMGGDLLYEIRFDTVGTKKLMATYARLTKE